MAKQSIKVGLALGGGAARGIAHVGVIQALEERDIPIDLIAGCSMGAVIGAIYACGVTTQFLQRIIYSLRDSDILDVVVPRQGLVKGKRAQELVLTLTGNRRFDQTVIPLAVTAVQLDTGTLLTLNEGPIHEAVRASFSIPGAFRPVPYNGKILVDGGVLERVPVQCARDMGADVVIAVDVGYRGGEMLEQGSGIIAVMMRSLEIMEWEVMRRQGTTADVLINPPLRGINMLSLADAHQAIELGYEETMRRMPEIEEAIERALGKRDGQQTQAADED